jgi:hypothetical protein
VVLAARRVLRGERRGAVFSEGYERQAGEAPGPFRNLPQTASVMVASSLSIVNAASAAIALASLLGYLLSLRTTTRSAARDEALALAETRAQTILELRRSVDDLVDALLRVRGDLEETPPDVEQALARIRRRVRDADVWSRVD